jgi:hypothetical protein
MTLRGGHAQRESFLSAAVSDRGFSGHSPFIAGRKSRVFRPRPVAGHFYIRKFADRGHRRPRIGGASLTLFTVCDMRLSRERDRWAEYGVLRMGRTPRVCYDYSQCHYPAQPPSGIGLFAGYMFGEPGRNLSFMPVLSGFYSGEAPWSSRCPFLTKVIARWPLPLGAVGRMRRPRARRRKRRPHHPRTPAHPRGSACPLGPPPPASRPASVTACAASRAARRSNPAPIVCT